MKIVRNPTFKTAVKVLVPTDDGQQEQQFTGRFRVLTTSEINDYDFRSADDTTRFLRDAFLGWEADLTDDDNQVLAATDDNMNLLVSLPYVRFALQRAYFDAVSGLPGAKRGN